MERNVERSDDGKVWQDTGEEVKKAVRKQKKGTLKSGQTDRKVKGRKQAVVIGLSTARKKGARKKS